VQDAFLVAQLKRAGALIAGKTVTTELAFLDPAATRNPSNPAHTPGGSSSGSAAAVAGGMVPFAVGTQTSGSVIRPASYCGVVGYMPTFGLISRTGVLKQSPSLDTVGVFAATVEDAALLAEMMQGHDPADPATVPMPFQHLADVARTRPPVTPTLAFIKQPAWDQADDEMKRALAELVEFMGGNCIEIDLPSIFDAAASARDQVQIAELTASYVGYAERGGQKLGPRLKEAIKLGGKIAAADYIAACGLADRLNLFLDQVFDEFDAIITPAAAGPAPDSLETTGSPAFNGLWTFCGTPAVTVPVFKAENGLPMGVQLVGRRGDDGRLLRTARWLHDQVLRARS
jgi:aspartyl-tRNA(Asn)/glutamyl-tRNA(Gln) amidotransferase subunit A